MKNFQLIENQLFNMKITNEFEYYMQFEQRRKDVKSSCVELLSTVEIEAVDYETLLELNDKQTINTDVVKLRDFDSIIN